MTETVLVLVPALEIMKGTVSRVVAIAAPAKNRRNRNMVNLLGCFKENWNLHWNCEQVREAALRNT